MRRVRDDDSGFTLTELLITIIILGILAGIVVFAVTNFTDDSRHTACKADIRSVQVAADAYRAKTGAYPAAGAITSALVPNYLKEAPSNADYTITLAAGGVVTGTMTSGGAC